MCPLSLIQEPARVGAFCLKLSKSNSNEDHRNRLSESTEILELDYDAQHILWGINLVMWLWGKYAQNRHKNFLKFSYFIYRKI